MIAKVMTLSFAAMEIALMDVERYLNEGSNRELIMLIKHLIPEYVSNNSVYEDLDRKRVSIPAPHNKY